MENGKVWHSAPENTAKETHLYSVTLESGERISDLEEYLGHIETKAANSFHKLILGELVAGQERANLASFLAMMFVRTNAFRRTIAELHAAFLNVKLYATAIHDGAFQSAMTRYEEEHGELTQKEKAAVREGMRNPDQFEVSIHREWTLRALSFHDDLVPILFKMNWTTMIAPEGRYFISSDNPLVRATPKRFADHIEAGGFLDKNVEVTFPLSPKACLLACWSSDLDRKMMLPAEGVKQANRARAIHAERFMYGPKFDSGIVSLANKYKETKPGVKLSGFGPSNFSPVTIRR